jgi:hypothetical protein
MRKPGDELWQLKRPSKKALRASLGGGLTLAAKAKHAVKGQTAENIIPARGLEGAHRFD